jgi:hypothetical protein
MRRRSLFLLILLSACLSGCLRLYDPEASQDQNSGAIAVVEAGQTFEQSFVSRRPRMDAVGMILSPPPDGTLPTGISAELYYSSDPLTPLATIQLTQQQVTAGAVTIVFPPQNASAGESYTLRLRADSGGFQVSGKGENVYPAGNAAANGEPLEGDATLRLHYDYDWRALLSDLWSIIAKSWMLIPLALLLLAPGFLVLDLLGLSKHFSGGERFAIWVGLSMAVLPVVMTWTSLFSLRWSEMALWLTCGGLCVLIIWRLWHKLQKPRFRINAEILALSAVVLVTLVVRLVMVRDLSAPPWVDSVHHGVITRLILETGGFPPSYLPFIDIDSAQYHAGFHTLLASFQWLTNLELQSGMLLLGQVISALAALAVYLLAVQLTGIRAVGIFAALIAGMFTPMPAYFTSWGRYTHLAGLVILPASFALIRWTIENVPVKTATEEALEDVTQDRHQALTRWWGGVLAAGILCAGLFLTHYRVTAFLGCLVLAYLLIRAITQVRGNQLPRDLGIVALVVVAALLMALPWIPGTVSSLVIPRLASWTGQGGETFNTFSWPYLTAGLGRYTLALAGLGLLWAMIKRDWFCLILVVWSALMFILANPGRLGLPGSGFINNTSVQITLYVPIAILGGYLLGQVLALLHRSTPPAWHNLVNVGVVVAAIPLIIIAARTMIPLLNPVTFLFRQADLDAMLTIEKNVPAGEEVVVNPFAWGYGLYAGNDGGYWISALAGRQTMPPPVLYGLENNHEAVQHTSELSQQLIEKSGHPDELAALMRQEGITYLFIGAKGGVFSARLLQENANFEMLHEENGTWLFRLRQENGLAQ